MFSISVRNMFLSDYKEIVITYDGTTVNLGPLNREEQQEIAEMLEGAVDDLTENA